MIVREKRVQAVKKDRIAMISANLSPAETPNRAVVVVGISRTMTSESE